MRIVMVDPSWNGVQTVEDLTRATGGRVTCLKAVSDYLSEQGHEVSCVMRGPRPAFRTAAGTEWTTQTSGVYDRLIALRGVGDGYSQVYAEEQYLWLRDLPHSGFVQDPELLEDFVPVYLSEYCREIWMDHFRVLGEGHLIPNGVDRSVFVPKEKDANLLIYASAPNRGLKYLPLIFRSLRIFRPELRLVAFSNLETLHPGEVGEDYTEDYQACRDAGIELMDPVPQLELADWLGRAALMIKPNPYPEICSNVELQALACGTPILTTGGLGASPEWIEDRWNGLLTRWMPHDYMVYPLEIARLAKEVLEGDAFWKVLCKGARATKILSWQEVGAQWAALLSA